MTPPPKSRAGRAGRRASRTGCCGASATSRRCAATARITATTCHDALELLEVDAHGFDESDRRLLRTIIDKFSGGPVGLNSLAAAIGEEKDAIEDINEPYLIQIGFLDRTSRGRVATRARLRILRTHGSRKGTLVVMNDPGRPLRPVKISGLATYVPPHVLTNSRPREAGRHVRRVDPAAHRDPRAAHRRQGRRDVGHRETGGVRRDSRGRAHARRHRLHRRRHDDAGHDLSEHRVHAAGEDRREATPGASTSAPRARASPTR